MERQFKIGDRVILGAHDNGEDWNDDMDKFVGTTATLIRTSGIDYEHFSWKVDTNTWSWRETNMKLAKPLRKYTNVCPCGIHPSHCDYHKDL